MLTEEEITERLNLVKINTEEESLTLKECLKGLSTEGLNALYKHYYCYETEEKKTKAARINYLNHEIPGQFIDYMLHMIGDKEKKIIVKLCCSKKVDINIELLSLAYYGFVYIT